MPRILRHICYGALLAAVLPTVAARAGNVIYLVAKPVQSLSTEGTMPDRFEGALDPDGQGSVLNVIQFGARLSANVHEQGAGNHMMIHQTGYGQVAHVAQTGFHNTLVVSQGN